MFKSYKKIKKIEKEEFIFEIFTEKNPYDLEDYDF